MPPFALVYSRRLDGISVGEFAVGAGAELPHHHHEQPHIALVTGGSLQSVPAALAHRNFAGRRDVKAIAIDVEPDDPFGAHDALAAVTAPRMLPRAESRATTTRLARALRSQGRAASLLMTGLVLELIALAVRERTGTTIAESMRGVRVNTAAEELAASNASIAEIAVNNGFCDQSHLTNVFRAVFGVTPAAYRRERRRR